MMTPEQIIKTIEYLKTIDETYIVEIVPEGEKTNYELCFYHKIDNQIIKFNDIVKLLEDNKKIGKPNFDQKHKQSKLYIVVGIKIKT